MLVVQDIQYSIPDSYNSCNSEGMSCTRMSISGNIGNLSGGPAFSASSKLSFACVIMGIVFSYFLFFIAIFLTRRISNMLGLAGWHPYAGRGGAAIAYVVQRPYLLFRWAAFTLVLLTLAWVPYLATVQGFVNSLNAANGEAFSANPVIGFILCLVAYGNTIAITISSARAGSRLVMAEKTLYIAYQAGGAGGAAYAALPGAVAPGYPAPGYPAPGYPAPGYPAAPGGYAPVPTAQPAYPGNAMAVPVPAGGYYPQPQAGVGAHAQAYMPAPAPVGPYVPPGSGGPEYAKTLL